MPRNVNTRAAVLCLILGLVLNLGIAWFAAGTYQGLRSYAFRSPSNDQMQAWLDHGPARDKPIGWAMRHRTAWINLVILGDDTQLGIAPAGPGIRLGASPDPNAPTAVLMEMRAGWPMHSIVGRRSESDVTLRFTAMQFLQGSVTTGGGASSQSSGGSLAAPGTGAITINAPTIILTPSGLPSAPVPWIPLWPGFVVNTLAIAAAMFLGWFLLFEVMLRRGRRRRRTVRGQCLSCGYDLRGDYATGCPECGTGRISTDEPIIHG